MAAKNLGSTFSRRHAVALGTLTAGGVVVGLAGCSAAQTAQPTAFPDTSGGEAPNTTGVKIGMTSEVPVGSGRNYNIDNVQMVVTQPTEGEFKAFSAVCTHQGCIAGCRDAEIVCDCHDSVFNLENGAVISGPATSALPEIAIRVENGEIYTA